MYISRVRLENIRGFSGPRNVDLTLTRPDGSHQGWTVLAGRNGSGKTTLLRAIALGANGLPVALGLGADFQDWISAGKQAASAELDLQADPHVDIWRGQSEVEPPVKFQATFQWDRDISQNPQQLGSQPLMGGFISAPSHGPWETNPTGWFCAGYGPFRRLVGGTADAQRLMAAPGTLARLASLFREDASLAEGVQWLKNEHLRTFEKRPGAEQLKNSALTILADGLLPGKYQVTDVDSEGLWVISNDHRFPLREMSDGYRTVAALVVDLLKQLNDAYGNLSVETRDGTPTITSPGVVLIDEVDAHLHVSWQKRIGGWLKNHFPNIQFIVTTHSPYICQAADESGLIRLPGPEEDEPPQVVEPDLYRRVVFGSGDDAVLSELFGLDSPYSEQAERLRRELSALEVRVVRGVASDDETDRYTDLRRRLTSSPVARVAEVAEQLRASSEPPE